MRTSSWFYGKQRVIEVTSPQFDPFNKRLARDIRNSLSRAFLQALAENKAALFQQCGADYLQRDLEPVYAGYIKERLEKYGEALVLVAQKKIRGGLAQTAVLWDLGLYFEMHELLELEWKNARGDRRLALQGLIRAAGMKVHAESRHREAAMSMAAKALAYLLKYGGELAGFSRYESVLAEIEQTLGADRPPSGKS